MIEHKNNKSGVDLLDNLKIDQSILNQTYSACASLFLLCKLFQFEGR